MAIIIPIPMKPHLAAFVRWRERLGAEEVYRISETRVIGRFLHMLLSGQSAHIRESSGIVDFNSVLKVEIPKKKESHYHLFLSDPDIIYFNSMVHDLMHDHLLDRIMYSPPKKQIQQSIMDLIKDMDAWGEIDFDTLKKANYRMRKSLGIELAQ